MSPADITGSAEFRAGLAQRLAEVGLIPPEQPERPVTTLAATPAISAPDDRKAA